MLTLLHDIGITGGVRIMIKNKFTKKIAVSLLVAGTVCGAIFTNIQAANTDDHYWQFYKELGNSGNHYISELRSKTDTTPAYVKISYWEGRSDDYVQMWVADQNHNSLQGGIPCKTVSGMGQYSIHSNAYELKGNSLVTIGFYAPWRATYSWSASGVWSPDSTREYN